MIHRFLSISLLWVLAWGQGRADDAVQKELARLDGTWIVVRLELNGMSLLEKDKPVPKLVIKGGKVTSETNGKATSGTKEVDLSKVLDPSKTPKTITMPFEGEAKFEIKFYGIYDVNSDEFRICGDGVDSREKNPEGRRPKEFESRKGLLLVLKREKK